MKHFIQCIIFIFCIIPGHVAGEPLTPSERVVSLGPIITEMIYLLEADKQLIANTSYCVIPDDAKTKEKIGSMIQMNVEKIVNLRPDLVLASPLSKAKQLKMLENLGIRVKRFVNPRTFSEICEMTLTLGEILGKIENARIVIDKVKEDVDATLAITQALPKKRVFMQIGIKPLHTANRETFVNEYIEYAGGVNIASNAKTGVYSREKVLQENPDVILIATMGSSKAAGEHEKASWMRYQSIKAARNKEIYVLDPDMVCSPTAVPFAKALKEIASILHPEIEALK